jgi:hypothetical protein
VGQNLQDHPACLVALPLKDKYDGIAITGGCSCQAARGFKEGCGVLLARADNSRRG